MNCAIYARVSTEEQAKGDSIRHQVDFFRDYAEKHGYKIKGIYIDEGVSGTRTEGRDGLARLISDARAGIFDVVLVKSISRLARNLKIAVDTAYEFIDNDIRLISIEDNIDTTRNDSRIMLGIHATLAEQESERISQRVKFGLRQKARNGGYTGSYAPYGYRRKDRNSITPAGDYTTVIVRRIFDMYLEGKGMRRIARILNSEGIPSPAASRGACVKSKLWTDRGIKVILANPVYAGCLKQCRTSTKSAISKKRIINRNAVIVENTHEAVITMEEYSRVQELMQERAKTPKGKGMHIFSHILFCGKCGCGMIYRKARYICGGYIRFGKEFCTGHSIREESLVEAIKADLHNMAAGKIDAVEILRILGGKMDSGRTAAIQSGLKDIEKRMRTLRGTLESLVGLYSEGAMDKSQLMEQLQEMRARRSELQKIRAALENHSFKPEVNLADIPGEVEKFLRLEDVNNAVMTKLIEKIIVGDDKCVEIYYNFNIGGTPVIL